jgi:transcriptional regulator with XRE-family HTH domain
MNNSFMSDLKLRQRLAKELRRLRKKAKLTQEQAAEKAGISHRYYCLLESTKPTRSAKIEIIDKLGKAFGKKFLNF